MVLFVHRFVTPQTSLNVRYNLLERTNDHGFLERISCGAAYENTRLLL